MYCFDTKLCKRILCYIINLNIFPEFLGCRHLDTRTHTHAHTRVEICTQKVFLMSEAKSLYLKWKMWQTTIQIEFSNGNCILSKIHYAENAMKMNQSIWNLHTLLNLLISFFLSIQSIYTNLLVVCSAFKLFTVQYKDKVFDYFTKDVYSPLRSLPM